MTHKTDFEKMEVYNPGRGRPSKAYRYINALAGIKSEIKKQVKKDVKEEIRRGRPESEKKSLRIINGHIIVKEAKSRIRIGNKSLVV